MSFSNPLIGQQPTPRPTHPCSVCNEPTEHGADVDRNDGRGWVRMPVCDSGCLSELMQELGGGAGSQVRARYPSATDPI